MTYVRGRVLINFTQVFFCPTVVCLHTNFSFLRLRIGTTRGRVLTVMTIPSGLFRRR